MKISYVMFDVTDKCNFKCKHCYKKQSDSYTDLDIEVIIRFLKELEERGHIPSIVISGGEPLLYKQLYNLLDFVCDGRSVRVNTNGILLNQNYEKLLKYNNLHIQVSLDGYNDETFYQIRNNHYFEQIIVNTKKAYEAGLNVYFRATLTSKTIDQYEKFIDVSKETKIPLVIRPMYNTGEPEQQKLKIKFEDLCQWQQNISDNNYLEYTGGKNLISESSCPLLQKNLIFSTLTVDNKGRVFPCQLLRSDQFYMGSIYNDSFDSIFSNSKKIVSSIKNIINSDGCRKCGFRENFGNGTCVSACYLGNKKCVKNKILGGRE